MIHSCGKGEIKQEMEKEKEKRKPNGSERLLWKSRGCSYLLSYVQYRYDSGAEEASNAVRKKRWPPRRHPLYNRLT